jgi:hypothetical protein
MWWSIRTRALLLLSLLLLLRGTTAPAADLPREAQGARARRGVIAAPELARPVARVEASRWGE